MKVRFDPKADALYVELNDSVVAESHEVSPGVILDFNSQQQVVGIEILGVKDRIPPASLKKVDFEVA